jgi:CubicO group peptidase (beta-lactamase class C family)
MTPEPQNGQPSSPAALMSKSRAACGVAVIRGSEVAWAKTRGGRPDLLFQAGSISKPVAALTALELVARGAAGLDTDVNDMLTSWRLRGAEGVTLRHLLSHSAGTGVPFMPGYRQDAELPTLLQSLDGSAPAATAAVLADPAAAGRFQYSGGGYAVLQQLITDLTGQPFADAARALVLEPLGMTDSTFEQPLPVSRRAAAARQDWHVYPEAAAAGLWTTPADLARFVCALQAAGPDSQSSSPAAGPHPGAARDLLAPAAALPARGEWTVLPLLGVRRPDSFGLGLFLTGGDWFTHTGGAHSFFSMLAGSTTTGQGAVVMVAANSARFALRLMTAVCDEEGWNGFRVRGSARLAGFPANLLSLR